MELLEGAKDIDILFNEGSLICLPGFSMMEKMKYKYISCKSCCLIGVGVSMTRDSVTLMVGQYFKGKRDVIEIVMVSWSGLGITIMSIFVKESVR